MGRRRWVILFLCAEVALYLAFLSLDIFWPDSRGDVPLKYLSMLLCAGMSLLLLRRGGSPLVCAALLLTLVADFFLLVLNRHYLVGICAFCVVQLLYLYRIHRAKGRGVAPSLVLRGLLVAGTLWALSALGALAPLPAVAAFYFIQLAVNAGESVALCPTGSGYLLFSVGLFLFVGCDLCVALSNLTAFVPGLPDWARVGMWLFYLPSQVLITLSAGAETERT